MLYQLPSNSKEQVLWIFSLFTIDMIPICLTSGAHTWDMEEQSPLLVLPIHHLRIFSYHLLLGRGKNSCFHVCLYLSFLFNWTFGAPQLSTFVVISQLPIQCLSTNTFSQDPSPCLSTLVLGVLLCWKLSIFLPIYPLLSFNRICLSLYWLFVKWLLCIFSFL